MDRVVQVDALCAHSGHGLEAKNHLGRVLEVVAGRVVGLRAPAAYAVDGRKHDEEVHA